MDYRIILSRPALRDLGEIARYIAQDDPTAAERVGIELVSLAESLATLPNWNQRRRRALRQLTPEHREFLSRRGRQPMHRQPADCCPSRK